MAFQKIKGLLSDGFTSLFFHLHPSGDAYVRYGKPKFRKQTVTKDAIELTLRPQVAFRLLRVEVNVDDTPTDTESLTVTLDSGWGSIYDVVLFSRDLSVGSVQDLAIPFGIGYEFEDVDEIDIAYANTGDDTVSVRVVYEELG